MSNLLEQQLFYFINLISLMNSIFIISIFKPVIIIFVLQHSYYYFISIHINILSYLFILNIVGYKKLYIK